MTETHPLSMLETPRIILVNQFERILGLDEDDIVVAVTKKHNDMPRAVLLKYGKKFYWSILLDNRIEKTTSLDTEWCSEATNLFFEIIEKEQTHNRISFSREFAKTLSPETLLTPIPSTNPHCDHLGSKIPDHIPVAIAVFKKTNCVYIFYAKKLGHKKYTHSMYYCDILPTTESDSEKFPLRIIKNETMATINTHDEIAIQGFINFCFKDELFLSGFIFTTTFP